MRCLPLVLLLACNGNDADTDPSTVDGEIVDNPDGTVSSTSPLVDATCIDGQWSEALPDPNASIGALKIGFNANDPVGFLVDVLERRYSVGATLVEGGVDSDAFGGVSCIDAFTTAQQRGNADGMLEAASTLVHECGHFYDIDLGGFTTAAYVITDDLTITCGS